MPFTTLGAGVPLGIESRLVVVPVVVLEVMVVVLDSLWTVGCGGSCGNTKKISLSYLLRYIFHKCVIIGVTLRMVFFSEIVFKLCSI